MTEQQMAPNIILTGFMGTGKTTVGKLLATELGYEFVDTDAMIEARSDMTIANIFAALGEGAFRAMEQEVARELSTQQSLVIATGGRMMLDEVNAYALGKTGRIFCLAATADEIIARVTADEKRVERPLLSVADPAQRVLDLLEERAPLYGQFEQITTSEKSPEQVAKQILMAFERVKSL